MQQEGKGRESLYLELYARQSQVFYGIQVTPFFCFVCLKIEICGRAIDVVFCELTNGRCWYFVGQCCTRSLQYHSHTLMGYEKRFFKFLKYCLSTHLTSIRYQSLAQVILAGYFVSGTIAKITESKGKQMFLTVHDHCNVLRSFQCAPCNYKNTVETPKHMNLYPNVWLRRVLGPSHRMRKKCVNSFNFLNLRPSHLTYSKNSMIGFWSDMIWIVHELN